MCAGSAARGAARTAWMSRECSRRTASPPATAAGCALKALSSLDSVCPAAAMASITRPAAKTGVCLRMVSGLYGPSSRIAPALPMSLVPGTRIGPYEILAPLGAGGMGEVYRAKDTTARAATWRSRSCPPVSRHDADRRARFEREAQAVAALSHPNIVAIHDTGVHEGQIYVVMELLAGQTLRERLSRRCRARSQGRGHRRADRARPRCGARQGSWCIATSSPRTCSCSTTDR